MESMTSVSFMYNGGIFSCSLKNGMTIEYSTVDSVFMLEMPSPANSFSPATLITKLCLFRQPPIVYQVNTPLRDKISKARVRKNFQLRLSRPLQSGRRLLQLLIHIAGVAH